MVLALENRQTPLRPSFPDDGRKYEWVNGKVQEVPTGFEHDAIAALVAFLLFPHARPLGVVTSSQAGFRMTGGNLRSPDVGFTRWERLPGSDTLPTGFLDAAPDLCVEVISPSETQSEMDEKVAEYFASGARQVWQLFPGERRVSVYRGVNTIIRLEQDDILAAGDDLLPAFRVFVRELFAVGPPAPAR